MAVESPAADNDHARGDPQAAASADLAVFAVLPDDEPLLAGEVSAEEEPVGEVSPAPEEEVADSLFASLDDPFRESVR